MKWQPIESCPIDGTRVLLFSGPFARIRMGFFRNGHFWTGDMCYRPSAIPRDPSDIFDYWMPLPEPPK